MDDYHKELERLFAGKSDEDLSRHYDDAVQWRDWEACDYIFDEQKRRAAAVPLTGRQLIGHVAKRFFEKVAEEQP